MTRKRAVKLLMARGYSRNLANALMYHKNAGESNFLTFGKYCAGERLSDSIARVSDAFYHFGSSVMELIEELGDLLRRSFCGYGERKEDEE